MPGRYLLDDEDRPGGAKVIVIGEQLWHRRFGGSPSLVGSTLTINGEAHTVVGIAPGIYTEMWRTDAWVPLAREPSTRRPAAATSWWSSVV